MSDLLANVWQMTNAEKIGLAKNRFIPGDLQMAIAKSGYHRACMYLASNEGLKGCTRDYLWSDDCNRGFTLKAEILSYGHYREHPEKYVEFYSKFGKRLMTNTPWRIASALTGAAWSYYYTGWKFCPTEVLDSIYEDFYVKKRAHDPGGFYTGERMQMSFVKHPNCSLKLAIQLSTHSNESIKSQAFKKIIELSK